jgi:transposase
MSRGRPVSKLCLTEAEQLELEKGFSIRKGAADERLRIQIVLSCAQGVSGTVIAQQLHTTTQTVSKWRRRYETYRFAGLSDAPRSGRLRTVSDEQVQAVVDKVRTTVPDNATHWSVRRMSAATGVSAPTVQRIWHAFGLKPHLQKTFKLSTDPHFVDKVRDV